MSRAEAERRGGAHRSIRRHLVFAAALLVGLVGGVGGWATATEFAGAVVASGMLVVDTNVKKVQHPTGGVVGELRVREGSQVAAGDVVLRLDETVTRANLAVVTKSLDELYTRQARLEAERDDAVVVAVPDELSPRADEPDVARIIAGERRLFGLRLETRTGQKAQLRERVAQLREEITGITGQIAAKTREIELIQRELEGVRELWRKNLIQLQRVTALERDAVRIEGEHGQLVAAAAQAKGRISETELQVLQVDQTLRSDVAKELREIQGKVAELLERKVAAEDQLKRVDVRAPQDGTVHQLAVHTVGGVVTAGEPIMLVVPATDALSVEVRIAPQDIDQVRIGQRALLRFSAFNQRTTPEILGEVSRISADLTTDQRTGASYFTLRIAVTQAEIDRLAQGSQAGARVRLVPGMPVDAFIQTGNRTVLSYLTKPLADQVAKAWRER